MSEARASQGIHGAGSALFKPEQYRAVVDRLASLPDGYTVTVETLSLQTGVPGRTVRAIVAQADGKDILLGGGGDGYRLARSVQDARVYTARIEGQALRMLARSDLRRRNAARRFRPDFVTEGER